MRKIFTIALFAFVITIPCALVLNYNIHINLWASQINPQTLEFYKAVGTLIVALVAAAIASLIQFRQWKTADKQWRTAHQKLNLELFDKRYEVFAATNKLSKALMTLNKVDEALTDYSKETLQAEWLFDESIDTYLSEDFRPNVYTYSRAVYNSLKTDTIKDSTTIKKAVDEYVAWHKADYIKRKKMFTPYLKLDSVVIGE